MHKSYIRNYICVSIERKIKYEGFGGGPLLVGGLGPGPPAPPLKSGPAVIISLH